MLLCFVDRGQGEVEETNDVRPSRLRGVSTIYAMSKRYNMVKRLVEQSNTRHTVRAELGETRGGPGRTQHNRRDYRRYIRVASITLLCTRCHPDRALASSTKLTTTLSKAAWGPTVSCTMAR